MSKLAEEIKKDVSELYTATVKKIKLFKQKDKTCSQELTLRDFFAVNCLKFVAQSGAVDTPEELMKVCYYYADEMLEARKK